MTAITVFVQSEGARDIRLIEVDADASVRDLLAPAEALGIEIARDPVVVVFLENGEDVLVLDDTLRHAGVGHHQSLHLHRCRRIAVVVHFNGKDVRRDFTPGTTVLRVKDWAAGPDGFKLTPIDAAEHVLQIARTTDRPDEDVHIGSLVAAGSGKVCEVAFDLVAKIRIEG